MTTQELYYQTKLMIGRLGMGVGMDLALPIWVTLYNAAQTDWWKMSLQTRADSVVRDQLAGLHKSDISLIPYQQQERSYRFKLPDDVYQFTGVYAKATKGACSRKLLVNPRSPQWVNDNWHNPMVQPDFDWEETFFINSAGDLLIYYRDFTITNALVSYYELPQRVDLAGYTHLDGTPSTTINNALPDELQQEILELLMSRLQK